ncbi:LLM class flavin-dependent oxidoreductase, partial [Streptomyces mesophilus]|uniref:LLM class flavin-dependent oxidoreductase n=1 Tax=Streptomyces mesophilus TaxID=1775132 RepID=UPI00332663D1
YNLDKQPEHAARYHRAREFMQVAARLWDSWEDDAEIRDAATGRFVDRARLHYVDFEGPHFSVRGPSIVPRPPQGRPPVVVALAVHDPYGRRELAARHADVVLLEAADIGAARLAREALLERVAEAGRDPQGIRVLLRVTVDLCAGGLAAAEPAVGPRFTGAATALAPLLAEWHTASGLDGFHLVPTAVVTELPLLVHGLVPRLREAGLFRAGYTGHTLRDHLGLTRPASRYAEAVR